MKLGDFQYENYRSKRSSYPTWLHEILRGIANLAPENKPHFHAHQLPFSVIWCGWQKNLSSNSHVHNYFNRNPLSLEFRTKWRNDSENCNVSSYPHEWRFQISTGWDVLLRWKCMRLELRIAQNVLFLLKLAKTYITLYMVGVVGRWILRCDSPSLGWLEKMVFGSKWKAEGDDFTLEMKFQRKLIDPKLIWENIGGNIPHNTAAQTVKDFSWNNQPTREY